MLNDRGSVKVSYLELENFKSFGGHHVVGPFHSNFSALIGPNGSGKSNIIDAILFVFGRRAQQLRHKNIKELIHRSKLIGRPEHAKVCVHFVMGLSSVIVGREVSLSEGSSRYTIDGKTVQHSDVANLLKSWGVDLENGRFLILQGEVEQVSLMPARAKEGNEYGLLEYLDELIGTDKLAPVIASQSMKVNQCIAAASEAQTALQIASNQKMALIDPSGDALKYVLLKRAILIYQTLLDLHTEKEVAQAAVAASAELSSMQNQYAEYQEARMAENKTIETLDTEIEQKGKVLTKAEKYLMNLAHELAEVERQDQTFLYKQEQSRKKRRKLEEEISRVQSDAVKKEQEADANEVKLIAAKKELPTLELEMTKVTRELESITADLETTTAQMREKLKAIEQTLEPFASEEREIKRELAILEAQIAAEDEHIKKNEEDVRKSEEEYKKASEIYTRKKTALVSAVANSEIAQNKIVKLDEELANLNTVIKSKTVTLENQQEAFARLLEDSKAENVKLYKAIHAEAKKGTFPGFIGFLWDLAEVDVETHGVALSAVVGSDKVLTEDMPTGQAIIEFVRSNNLGRVSVITMQILRRELGTAFESFKSQIGGSRYRAPEGCVPMMNIIKNVKPEYELAFFYFIRDALLANGGLELARKVAFKDPKNPLRVITLGGDIVDKGGTLTGGDGENVLKEKIARAKRRSENGGQDAVTVEGLEKSLKELTKYLETGNQEAKRISEEIRTQETLIESTRHQIERLKSELVMHESHLAETKSENEKIRELKLRSCVSPDIDREAINQKIARMRMAETKIEQKVKKIEKERDVIKDKMNDLGGAIRKQLVEKKAKCQDALDIAAHILTNGNADAARLRSQAANLIDSKIPALKAEIAAEEENIAALEMEKEKLVDQALGIQQKQEEVEKIRSEAKRECRRLVDEVEVLREKMTQSGFKDMEFQSALAELERKVEKARSAIEKCGKTAQNSMRQLKDLPDLRELMEEGKENTEESNMMIDEEGPRIKWDSTANEELHMELNGLQHKMETGLLDQIFDTHSRDDLNVAKFKAEEQLMMFQGQINRRQRKVGERDDEEFVLDLTVLLQFKAACDVEKNARNRHNQLRGEREAEQAILRGLEEKRRREFMIGFKKIARKVKEVYQMLTLGGDAELDLREANDPYAKGIGYAVRPPKKSWRTIQNISGGERTLSSLALVFALHSYKPTPFYFMDEIDAALDATNVTIIANYIAERALKAQFIVVSLRSQFFERATRLIGVCKAHELTRVLAIDPDEFSESKAADFNATSGKCRASVEYNWEEQGHEFEELKEPKSKKRKSVTK